MEWPYNDIDYNDFAISIARCKQIIEDLGGNCIAERKSTETWLVDEENCITEQVLEHIYRFQDSYVCVDKIYFPEKPFIVLEFGDEIDGPYEDADPFPYDLPLEELKLEVQYALGLLPYPE